MAQRELQGDNERGDFHPEATGEHGLSAHLPIVLRVAWPTMVVMGLLTLLAAVVVSLEASGHKQGLEQITTTGKTRTAVAELHVLAQSYGDFEPSARLKVRDDLSAAVGKVNQAHEELMAASETELSEFFGSHQQLDRVSSSLDFTFEQMQRSLTEFGALMQGERIGVSETSTQALDRLAESTRQYLLVLDHIDLKVANAGRDKLMRLQIYEAGAIAVAGLLLITLALTVMRPSHHLISRQIEELKASRSLLAQAMIAAEKVALARERLLYALSHDVRAPLQTILLNVELLRSHPSALAESEEIDRVARSAQRVKTLIDDLLNKGAKMEEAKLAELDVALMIEELFETYSAHASERGLEMSVEVDPQLPLLVAREGVLRRVLDNLLTNAIKYTQEGGVTIRAQSKLFDDERFVNIEVSDTGPGLGEDQVDEVFEERRRLSSDQEGHGLGLAIARQLVNDELYGELLVSSTVGQGSTFSVVIPVAAAGGIASTGWKPEDFLERLRQTGAFEDLVVLVVGDARAEEEIRQLGACVLMPDPDVAELVEQFSDLDVAHLVVFDADTLEGGGCPLCAQLREAGFGGPLVGLYSDATRLDRDMLITSGCDALLRKPANAVDLVEWLARALTHSHTDVGDVAA